PGRCNGAPAAQWSPSLTQEQPLMWNLFKSLGGRRPTRRRPVTRARLAPEELESRLVPSANVLDFSAGFAGSKGVLTYNNSAAVSGTSAELTNGPSESASVFSTLPADVTRFSTQFTFQLSPGP